jgi:hypothetical protein
MSLIIKLAKLEISDISNYQEKYHLDYHFMIIISIK